MRAPNAAAATTAVMVNRRVRQCAATEFIRRASSEPTLGRTHRDLREADHGDDVLFGYVPVVQLGEEGCHVLGATDLRVVVLDLARRELGEALHLDLVDDGVEDLLPRAEADTAEHRDDLTLLVLLGLVAEADRGGLALRAELIRDDRRVEVQCVHRSPSVSTGRREAPS